MRVTRLFAAAALALASTLVQADDAEQAIRKTLTSLQLDVPVDSIASSPLNGLYEVRLQGGRVLYASADGQYVMQGYLYQLKDGKPVNLTEQTERAGVAKLIDAIPQAEMVVFPAKGDAKSHITVFTDTTCPYCQKLHAEVPKLNAMGIEVRYLAFPRQGLNSPGDQQLQAVWCSKDRPVSLSKMIEGKSVDAPQCDNPVSKQFALGQQIGVNGTPAIILENGQMVPGYQPAAQVAKLALDAKG
ncbi:bifunctional protein-disulfide isomerase/oxidoreductase DsbC [Pseudomonas typographi]|uniref:Thiol:disulfide interchange protein n=1 Tax=Pseudomonas typographi TaxID=2715964 RepID=A0ABR7Z809_9PSED|nr:bifunctional protein-disulfide isomerase/oxidoreductase DsbC [Pseudomonas typographi]MBD1601461.1 bifunctional protein-disulfide isomerase/oxidoreductase DsbC [Pseudomonas typographi]